MLRLLQTPLTTIKALVMTMQQLRTGKMMLQVAADAADAEMAPASRQFDEETTVSHIMGTRWQDRGPTWTGNTAELWKRQKFRPLSQRWGNRGGGSRTWYAVFHRALRAGKSDAEAAVIANAEVGPRPPKP